MDGGINEKSYIGNYKKINKSGNRLLHGFLIFFLLGYGIFFSSKLWLKAPYEGVPITPIGKTVTEEDRSVTVNSWKYCRNEKKMEILVNVENLSLDGVETYNWKVKTISRDLETKVIMESKDLTVLEVKNVPRRWTEAALVMELKKSDRNKGGQFKMLKLYTNEKNVKKVSSIKRKTLKEYKTEQINEKINGYKVQLSEMKKSKREIERSINNADKKINDLTLEMKNQTANEQMKTGEEIINVQAEKERLTESLNSKKEDIAELKEKIKIQEGLIKSK